MTLCVKRYVHICQFFKVRGIVLCDVQNKLKVKTVVA